MNSILDEFESQCIIIYQTEVSCIAEDVLTTPQIVNWFIHTKDLATAQIIKDILNRVCPKLKYFSNYSVEISGQDGGPCNITIHTEKFIFSAENVVHFSKALFIFASKYDAVYDFWEINF